MEKDNMFGLNDILQFFWSTIRLPENSLSFLPYINDILIPTNETKLTNIIIRITSIR